MLLLLVCVTTLCGAVHTNAVAHRGASGQFPENTIKAFQEAEKQGAEWFEWDAQLSIDGVVSGPPSSPH